MKRSLSRSRSSRLSGFTLIELLTVIAIIAILAGVLLTAAGPAFRAAERAKAMNMANQIQTACTSYYTEYSVYPVPTATTTDSLIGDTSAADGASWATLICVLCGNVHPSDGTAFTAVAAGPTNTRAIAFLNLKSTDVFTATSKTTTTPSAVVDAPINPLPSSTSPATSIYLNIAFDSDYSGVIGDAASAVNGKIPNFSTSTVGTITLTGTSTAGIAVWANCNGNTTVSSQNPNFYVHTF